MRHRCGTACFLVFLIFSLLVHLTELALQAWVAVGLYQDGHHVWFSILLGLFIVPILTVQLLSCQWAWPEDKTQKEKKANQEQNVDTGNGARNGRANSQSGAFRCLIAIPHLLCAAMPWRYARLILTCGTLNTQKELAQVCLLRVFLAFSSSLPVLLLETYLLLNKTQSELGEEQLVLYCALGITLFSVCWSLATHRKRSKDYHFLATLISWPGTVFRVTWRFGELTGRILVLALFAGLHSFWIFLVLALHWITMIMWSLTEQMTGKGTLSKAAIRRAFLSSYIHVFCYLNTGASKARNRLILFYVLLSLENAVLLVLWFLYDQRTYLHIPMIVIIGGSYLFAFISAILYYNCFHVKSARVVQRGAEVMYMQPCMNCQPLFCDDKQRGLSQGDTFHHAWWIEVKENTEANPNSYDMLMPSELKRNGGGKRLSSIQKAKHIQLPEEVRYWGPPQGDLSSSALYETLSQYQKQGRRVSQSLAQSQGKENMAFPWDDYTIQLSDNHLEGCLDPACRGRCLSHHPHQISDSGISATTTNTTSSEHHSGSRLRSDDISLLYTSDTSDMTSIQTSLSYLDPIRIHRMSLLEGEDDWSMTSSSYGMTSSESLHGINRYLPMLAHLNNMVNNERPGEQLVVNDHTHQELQKQHSQLCRSPAPLPLEVASVVIPGVVPPTGPDGTIADHGPTSEVHYDHVPSNLSQTDGGTTGRRMRIRMGRHACYANRRSRRRRSSSNGSHGRKLANNHYRRAVPCGVAGKLHRRGHSDASDTICSRSSFAASTTDSYDGSLSDWADLSDRASCSLQLPGTQSDLDFSVCGDYPYTTATTNVETENEYVEPTPANQLHILEQKQLQQHQHQHQRKTNVADAPQQELQQQPLPPKIIQKLDESGRQIGFVC